MIVSANPRGIKRYPISETLAPFHRRLENSLKNILKLRQMNFPAAIILLPRARGTVTRYILDASVRAGSGYARGEIVKLRERSDARDRLCVTLELRVSGRSFGSPRIYSVIINAAR